MILPKDNTRTHITDKRILQHHAYILYTRRELSYLHIDRSWFDDELGETMTDDDWAHINDVAPTWRSTVFAGGMIDDICSNIRDILADAGFQLAAGD